MGRGHALIYYFGSLNGYYTVKYIADSIVKGSLTRGLTNIGSFTLHYIGSFTLRHALRYI